MKAKTIAVMESTGRVLCCTIFRAGGKKLLAKGHVISEEDARMLETEGMNQVWVTELEEGEVGEDDAVMQVASEIGCGALEIRLAPGGRANLFTTEPCCVLVDDELLKQINCTASMAIATSINFSYARSGQRVATVKSTPFAVARQELEAMISIVKERGPILQARPIRAAGRGHSVHRPGQRRTSPSVVRKHHAAALGSHRDQRQLCPLVGRGGGRCGALPTASIAFQANRRLDRIHHRPRGSGRCDRPRHGSSRMLHRAFLGSRRARQSVLAGLQRRCPRRIRAWLLPLRETKRRGLDAPADAGPLSCLWLGSRLPGAWRIARL